MTTNSEAAAGRVLELATGETPTTARLVSIDGVEYPYVDPERLSIAQQMRLQKLGGIMAALQDDEPTEAMVVAAVEALDESVKLMLPTITDEVLGKLTDFQKTEIMRSFTSEATESDEPVPPTSSLPSPPSLDSMGSQSNISSTSQLQSSPH